MKKIVGLILLGCLFGCEEILYEEDITTGNVALLAPTNDASMFVGDVTFSWQIVNGATSYELQVATPAFANASQIVIDTIITDTGFNQLLDVNNYEWRVKGLNSAYETEYSSNAFEVIEAIIEP